MKKIINKSFLPSIYNMALVLIVGIILAFNPATTLNVIGYIIAIILLARGVTLVISNVNRDGFEAYHFLGATAFLVLGILILIRPGIVASILPIIVGIVFIATSLNNFYKSMFLRKIDNKKWFQTLLISILTLLCGVFLLFNPFEAASTVVMVTGIIMIIYAILNLIDLCVLKRDVEDFIVPKEPEKETKNKKKSKKKTIDVEEEE